ncbi:hypothetical protein GCM10009772_25080 [Pseudonocardia alni subsp. carboxydivorans]
MQQTASEMRASLAKTRAALTHNLSTGEALEESFRKFLRRHLPASIGVTKGQIIDSKGGKSRQIDAIVYDASRTPILFSSEEDGQQVVPNEGVLAVFEIKATINRSDMQSVVDHMQSVKSLDKSAYYSPNSIIEYTTNLYGKELAVPPTLYFLFSYESGELGPIADELRSLQSNLPLESRIDCACVLDRGMLLNATSTGVTGTPEPGSNLAAYPSENSLLMFYLLFSRYLLQFRFNAIAIQKYIPANFSF